MVKLGKKVDPVATMFYKAMVKAKKLGRGNSHCKQTAENQLTKK